jgi:hypothetical protein
MFTQQERDSRAVLQSRTANIRERHAAFLERGQADSFAGSGG